MAGSEGESKTGPDSVGAREAVVDVDPIIADADGGELVALRGQVLLFGGNPRLAHQELIHHPGLPARQATVNTPFRSTLLIRRTCGLW